MAEGDIELLRGLYERWGRGDYDTLEFFDPQVQVARIGSEFADLAGEWQGIDAMQVAVGEYMRAWKELRIRAERFIDLADGRVLVLDRQVARGRGTGVAVERETAWFFTLRDGKIVRWEGYWDRAEAMRAAGLEP